MITLLLCVCYTSLTRSVYLNIDHVIIAGLFEGCFATCFGESKETA